MAEDRGRERGGPTWTGKVDPKDEGKTERRRRWNQSQTIRSKVPPKSKARTFKGFEAWKGGTWRGRRFSSTCSSGLPQREVGFVESAVEWFGKVSCEGYRGRCRGWHLRGGVIGGRQILPITGELGDRDRDNPFSQADEDVEEEESEGEDIKVGGYKRHFFKRIARTAGQSGRCCQRGTQGEKERQEVISREDWVSHSKSSGRTQGEEGKEGKEEEERQAKEEEEAQRWRRRPIEFWDDRFLRRQLRAAFRGGEKCKQRRVRESYEEEEQGAPRLRPGTPRPTREGAAGAVFDGHSSSGESSCGSGDQDPVLLPDPFATTARSSDGTGEGDVSDCFGAGSTPQREPERCRRRLSSSVLRVASKHHRWQLECSPLPGDLLPGRHLGHVDGYASPDSSPCEVSSKSLRSGSRERRMVARRPWSWWKGFKRTQRRWRSQRQEGRKRKRGESERESPQQLVERRRWQRRQRSPGLGEVKGAGQGCLRREEDESWLANSRADSDSAMVFNGARGPPGDFGRALELCDSMARMGCIMSWLLVQSLRKDGDHYVSQQVLQACGNIAAKSRALPSRRKGEALPLRLGGLQFFKDQLSRMSLTEAAAENFVQKMHREAWLLLAVAGLNRLYGSAAVLVDGPWTKLEIAAVENLRAAIDRRSQHDPVTATTFLEVEKDILSKRVGYDGEEVFVCHPLSLEQVEPSLPPMGHGGVIKALDWVGPSSRRFLLNPQDCLLEKPNLSKARIPGRVHVVPGEKVRLAKELVKRNNICVWHPLEDIHKIGDEPLLNGMFGVPKSATVPSGACVLRLIMNLIPSNCCLQQLQGKVSTLPSINVWQSIYMEEEQELRLFQSDMSSAFYLFALPPCWYRYLGFNIVVSAKEAGMTGAGLWALCCAVIPMGWSSSVGLMQEISENLLLRGGLDPRRQVRRGSTLPEWMVEVIGAAKDDGAFWWHVYLGNFCAAEKVLPPEGAAGGEECHRMAEAIWDRAGVLSSAKKRKCAEQRIEELGAEVDGELGTLGGSNERLRKNCLATLWLLHQRFLKRKHVQIVAGRWVFAMQFRRPTMSIFNAVWSFVGGKKKCRLDEVRRELATAVMLCPLMHTFLKAPLTDVITASDASSTGGAVSMSRALSLEGKDFAGCSRLADGEARVAPILVLSLFNGIGGAFRCYDICGIRPVARIAFDTCKESNRVTQKRWPDTLVYRDVRDLGPAMVREWRLKFGDLEEIHVWAGFPCVDLSSAKAYRLNLEGPGSSLFWEVPRIMAVLRVEFKDAVKIKHCLENVASMDVEAAQQISEALQTTPYRVDCSDAVPMHRPRYAWLSERIEDLIEGVEFEGQHYWTDIIARCPYPATDQWLQEGRTWEGEHSQTIFPTCMKAIPRSAPPAKPAGLSRCDGETISRWRSDSYRFPPYQYRKQFLITTPSSWRLLSPVERELLLGYGFRHTAVCMSASDIKSNPTRYEDVRLSLLGDSFSIYSFVIFAYALSINYVTRAPYQHWCQRMGMAPGFLAPPRLMAHLCRKLQYGTPLQFLDGVSVSNLNSILLKRTDHTGSDVRLVSGEQLASKIFPRQAVCAQWWHWEPCFHLRWKQKAHINLLELEAILLACKYQVGRLGISQSRIFHISDSYVCISIVSKGRSGSMVLQKKLRQLAAFLLAFGLQLVVAHVESTENPTDAASRA